MVRTPGSQLGNTGSTPVRVTNGMKAQRKKLFKHRKTLTLGELPSVIPKYSYSLTGQQMEPINLVLFGGRRSIDKLFETHGWFKADPLSLKTLIRASWVSLLNREYRSGPMSPSYIKGKHYQLAVEHSTESDTFRHRHHVRFWKTGYKIGKQAVWIGTASYDRSIGFYKDAPIPTHHIAPTLAWEEKFLAHSLDIKKPTYLRLGLPEEGKINTGDSYNFDGRALLVNLA